MSKCTIQYIALLALVLVEQVEPKETFLARIDEAHSPNVLAQIKSLGLAVFPIGLEQWYQLHAPHAAVRLKPSTPSLWKRRLNQLPGIISLTAQKEKKVSLRQGAVLFNETLWQNGSMWYWQNTSSMHVQQVWERGFRGSGVQITVIDDGVDNRNQEFTGHFNLHLSYDYTRRTPDPRPAYGQTHGTKVAGVAAGTLGNGFCGGGAAPGATVVGVRLIGYSGGTTPANEAESLVGLNRHETTDIFVASWGALDDGQIVDGPEPVTKQALEKAATKGRHGRGSLFIVAAGNGGDVNDDCICDGYASGEYAIAVQAVNRNGTAPYYTEPCATAMTSVYVDDGLVAPLPIAFTPSCSLGFAGTSAAAPAAAGVLALVLEHSPNLTRRDLLHLIVHASDPSGLDPTGWITTGSNLKFHPRFGFGLLDAQRLDDLADSWKLLSSDATLLVLPDPSSSNPQWSTFAVNHTGQVERVTAKLSIKPLHSRGDIEVFISSPVGTRVPILNKRVVDKTAANFDNWDFSTVAFWDQPLNGTWKVQVVNGTVSFIELQVIAEVDVQTTTTSTTTTSSTTTTTSEATTSSTSIVTQTETITSRPANTSASEPIRSTSEAPNFPNNETTDTSKHLSTEYIVIIAVAVLILEFVVGMIFLKFVVRKRTPVDEHQRTRKQDIPMTKNSR